MYLRTLKAARSEKNFGRKFSCQNLSSEEFYIFFHLDLGGVSIFSPKTQKCHVYFCTTKGGGGGVGPEGTQITKVCTNVHTCMYICHLAPPPPGCLIKQAAQS